MMDKPLRFTFAAYVKDKASFLVMTALMIAFLTGSLIVQAVSIAGIVTLDASIVIGVIVYLAFGYSREARFWRALAECANALEKSSYFGDLAEEPKSLRERIAYACALAIVNADRDEIASLHTAVRENSEYIGLWVHEVKTPLAAAKLIARRMQGRDALALRRELERMNDLIEQALFAARMEALDRDYLIHEVNLSDIAKEACKSHMHYLTSLDVSLDFQIDPSVKVYADKIWLEFIITQIVINAAKYDAKIIEFTAFDSEEESSSACTVLQIKDNGCGIPASDVPRVFQRGFTGEVGRSHGSATGMGLYLVARMCQSMGLSVMLASEEGVGTRVQISFPHDRRRIRLSLEPDEASEG